MSNLDERVKEIIVEQLNVSDEQVTEAAKFGNLAAAVTVKKLGTTGTATPSELLSVAGDHFGWS